MKVTHMARIDYSYLIEKQKTLNNGSNKLPFNLDVKVRRALSWIEQAEHIEDSNSDNRFLFYWIGFNALYSSKIEGSGSHTNEHVIYRGFFEKLLKADKKKRIYNMVWGQMKPQFRQLINNKYLFGYFWKFHIGELEADRWEPIFLSMNQKFAKNLKHDHVPRALADVFSRLYVLRNQIIHGGSTWGGDRNRNQVKICSRVISLMVPLMVDIMLDSPEVDWGELHYPILDTSDNRLGDATSDLASASDAKGEEAIAEPPEASPEVKQIASVSDVVEVDSEKQENQKEVAKRNSGLFGVLREKLLRIFERK